MKSIFNSVMLVALTIAFYFENLLAKASRNLTMSGGLPTMRLKQGGFVLLSRAYGGYSAGQTVELPKSTEDALIAAGIASTSAGPATTGALSTNLSQGAATIAIGAASVMITNPNITAQSVVWAAINQAAADGTALYVARVVPAAGSVTIYVNANATALTRIKWAILGPMGNLSNPT